MSQGASSAAEVLVRALAMPGKPHAVLCLCFLGIPSVSSLFSGVDGRPDPSSIEEEKRGEDKVVRQE